MKILEIRGTIYLCFRKGKLYLLDKAKIINPQCTDAAIVGFQMDFWGTVDICFDISGKTYDYNNKLEAISKKSIEVKWFLQAIFDEYEQHAPKDKTLDT